MGTIIFMVLFSQYLTNVALPLPTYKDKKIKFIKVYIFKLFPVLMTIIVMWIICAICTANDVFDSKSPARTDLNLHVIENSSWIRVPYPCKFVFY